MTSIVSLCKRRGFVFQSSEIYGGLRSSYDYGYLGVELKRNIAAQWWQDMVYGRENVVGMDAAIIMHPKVWKASGHLANFSDPLVDCYSCKERFRSDKAPKVPVGSSVKYKIKTSKQLQSGVVGKLGVVCPNCGSTQLSPERRFNGMFQTSLGPVDPLSTFVDNVYGKDLTREEFTASLHQAIERSAVHLRPETAQAMFVQFLNMQATSSLKIPFGLAQIGKSFRNEIVVEHFIFRSCEFEQMEMEFFCEPGTQLQWLNYWRQERLKWHQSFANNPSNYRLRRHDKNELAHYCDDCYDIEYNYPWGWDELEGVASRTDYDLKKHASASGAKLSYFDPQKVNPVTGKTGSRYVPYVVEPACGLTRTFLCVLLDAYTQEKITTNNDGPQRLRTVLRLDPRLAPYKAAILPLIKKDNLPETAKAIADDFRKAGLNVSFDEMHSIGRRYARHDEVGTPYCVTIDRETISDNTVTIRDRDTMEQKRMPLSQTLEMVKNRLI